MTDKNNIFFESDALRRRAEKLLLQMQSDTSSPSTVADDLKLYHELQVQHIELEMQNEELREAQADLDASRIKFTELFDFAPNSYFTLSDNGEIKEVNHMGATLLRINRSVLKNRLFQEFIVPEDREIFFQHQLNLVKTRDHQVCEVKVFRSDGQRLFVKLVLSIVESKGALQILVIATDITLQKQIEDTQSFLLEHRWAESNRDFFEVLAEYLAKTLGMDYVCIDKLMDEGLEAQTVAVYFDGHFEDNVKYALKDTPCGSVVGQSLCVFPREVRHLFPKDIVLQDMLAESYVGITLWGSNGKPVGLIAIIGRKPLIDIQSSEMILKMVSIRAVSELEHRRAEEELSKSYDKLDTLVTERTAELQKVNESLVNEITVRNQKEQHLKIAEEKYRTVADFTYDWETWLDPAGKYEYVSPSCLKITGYTVEEFMEDPALFNKIAHPDDRNLIENHFNEVLKNSHESWSFDFRIITRDGRERWIGHSCQPVFNAGGDWLGQRASNRDITARKMTELLLIESQKQLRALTQRMDAITEDERIRISREIHDELGHLLTALKFDIEEVINQADLSVALVKADLHDMVDLVDSLINAVRKIATELRPGILDHLGLFPSIDWQIRQFRVRTKICCSFNQDDLEVTFDPNETSIIFRILQEILTNVARHSKASHVNVSLSKADGYFILRAVDNGIGFVPQNQYQTTSLGLMGMQERALSIGGEIQIDSAPGEGTAVTFLLSKN